MPLAPAIGAALTTAAAHPWGLFLGGLDVTKEPGGAMGFGVDPTTVVVTEAGPGDVSSMSFEVDDPELVVGIVAGTEVSYWNLEDDVCLFRGWVDHYDRAPMPGGQGRTLTVDCTGIEQILDWTIVPAGQTLFSGTQTPRYIGFIAQQYAPQLRVGASLDSAMGSPPYTRNGTFSFPVGSLRRPAEPMFPLMIPGPFPFPGATLRETIRQLVAVCSWWNSDLTGPVTFGVSVLVTVDFFYGLRVWENDPALQPDDYTTLTVLDTFAGPTRAAGLRATVDYAGLIRSVYVAGFDAASSGLFSDGSGIYGRTTLLSDSTITTAEGARVRAAGLMAADAASVRGSFTIEDFDPPATVHAGSLVSITDAATGLATTYRITEITKRFTNSSRQTWTVTFGGLAAASGARLIRRFTRAELN